MRSRISIRGCVRPSVGPSVRPLVGPSHTSWISKKWAEFEQNSITRKYAIWKTIQRQICGQLARTHLLSEFRSTCCLSVLRQSLMTVLKKQWPLRNAHPVFILSTVHNHNVQIINALMVYLNPSFLSFPFFLFLCPDVISTRSFSDEPEAEVIVSTANGTQRVRRGLGRLGIF